MRRWICPRRLSDVPLPYIAIVRAREEVERGVFCNDALHCIVVAAEGPLICVGTSQSDGVSQVLHARPTSTGVSLSAPRTVGRVSGVLDIEDANVVGTRDYSAVIRVGHELDGEYIRPVARDDGGRQAELLCVGAGVVRVDVDAVVV
jgi:hypothetical protein